MPKQKIGEFIPGIELMPADPEEWTNEILDESFERFSRGFTAADLAATINQARERTLKEE